jgi:hypothetical protein
MREMEINSITATIYNVPESVGQPTHRDRDKISLWHLPKIAWACAILFSINLLIVGAIAISPELNVDIYGEAAGDLVLAGAKPSPFVQPEPPPRPVRTAMKMVPVVEFLPEAAIEFEISNMPVKSASLDMPRASERASMTTVSPAVIPAAYRQSSYVSGSQAYEASEKQMNFPRMTASASPRPLPATLTGTQELTPRKVTEREIRPTVVN